LATTQQRSVHVLTLRRILPQLDNTCGESGFKFVDNHQRSVGFTAVAATSYTSWMSAVRKRLQSGVKTHTHTLQETFHFSRTCHLLAGIAWILYRILFESDEKRKKSQIKFCLRLE